VAPLVALVALRVSGFDLGGAVRAHRRALLILAAPIVGAVVMGGLIGKAWGYYGRMPSLAFPLGLASLSVVFSAWVNAGRTRRRIGAAATVYLCAIGTSLIGFPWGPLGTAREGGSFGVTPHTYAESAGIFRRVAAAADLRRPSVLTPDVGGLALCCDEFRIVDLAMLSNRRLAHRGPAALAEVLASEAPEIVEAHWEWAAAGRLYQVPYFRGHYAPAFVAGTKFWLRRELAGTIEAQGRGCWLPADREDVQQALRAHRYRNQDLAADRRAFEQPWLVLSLKAKDGGLCP
jgi:hypothetical protein